MDDINKIGLIFEELEKNGAEYTKKFPKGKRQKRMLFGDNRNITEGTYQFIKDLKNGRGGIYGKKYYKAIEDFMQYAEYRKGRKIKSGKGVMVWKILWAYCYNCRYLRNRYAGSFKRMVEEKAAEWLEEKGYASKSFPNIDLSREEWENLAIHIVKKIGQELYCIGEELACYILSDIKEFFKAGNVLFKLDSSNANFIKKTGLIFLPYKEGVKTIEELKKEWNSTGKKRKELYKSIINLANPDPKTFSVRMINRNIYAYNSEEESYRFGYCRNDKDCERCKAKNYCLSGRLGVNYVLEKLKELGFN